MSNLESPKSEAEYHGWLFVVTKDIFAAAGRNLRDHFIQLKKGEIIEFRFYSPCNFRTSDEKPIYASLSQVDFDSACQPIGKIWENVGFNNKAQLHEILSIRLFDFKNNWTIEKLRNFGCESFPTREEIEAKK